MARTETGYNIGLMYTDLYLQAEAASNKKKDALLLELQSHNDNLKDVAKLVSALTEKKASGKADFSHSPEFKDLIDRIWEKNKDPETNQSVIPSHQYCWKDENSIDIALQGLNDRVKILGQEANNVTMYIQQEYHDMNAITDSAKKFLEMINETIRTIQSRTGRA
ncbi:MAG: hypothetical protein FJZ57_02755 [Chlamydiae bacterium]|nr:hypothetical protein [Chlamydiota bacterium]